MTWLNHLSVRAKLAALVAILALGMLVVAGVSLWSIQRAVAAGHGILRSELGTTQDLGNVRAGIANMRRYVTARSARRIEHLSALERQATRLTVGMTA
ncbi:MCP four helix bundle domain-containing protein [Ramlibacter rhizophilus]|uniref:Chemotaxis methyl-accepting receptor HlyB-like 4HB MCP domain-containing protein n=1 Tax=Ramlibacter rhizophilus TaxID=1781167 RepID=A0A4Z0BHT8_9BURK|nr:MCP four helix bundle domain-containing protein [Ramlibacter rhizophilus]TFY97959.1 hypothetical protein EZ242_16040 [Ramlibacter rhizophilus]